MENNSEKKKNKLISLLKKRIVEKSEYRELSEIQKSIWLYQYEHPTSYAYNIIIGLRIYEPINAPLLKACWQTVCEEHKILFSRYPLVNGIPNIVIDPNSEVSIKQISIPETSEAELYNEIMKFSKQPFNLESDTLMRFGLFSNNGNESIFIIVFHHIISDIWSCSILLNDFIKKYNENSDFSIVSNQLSRPKFTYLDFIHDEKAILADKSLLKYWLKKLRNPPQTSWLIPDYNLLSVDEIAGDIVQIKIPEKSMLHFKATLKANNITLYSGLLTLLVITLYKYTTQTDIIIGSTTARRELSKYSDIVGCLMNPIAIRVNFKDSIKFLDLCKQVQATVIEAMQHQNYPFSSIVSNLTVDRSGQISPLFQSGFEFQQPGSWGNLGKLFQYSYVNKKIIFGNLLVSPYFIPQQTAQLDLMLSMIEETTGLVANFKYKTSIYKRSTIVWLAKHFLTLIENINLSINKSIKNINMLTENEYQILLTQWNKTTADYSTKKTYNQLFSTAVNKYPQNTAIEYKGLSITYSELQKMTNRYANYIHRYLENYRKNIKKLILIFMPRSIDFVTIVLAAFKAGAAYLPIEVDYPKNRISYIIENSEPIMIVTTDSLKKKIQDLCKNKTEVITIEELKIASANFITDKFTIRQSPNDLAYVIYTSGSTGQPKGVMIEHAGMLNRILWMQDKFNLSEQDKILHKTPVTFDVSVWEILWPLITGATLVIAEQSAHSDPFYLSNIIVEKNITDVHFVPAMLEIFIQNQQTSALQKVKRIYCSGEALSKNTANTLLTELQKTKVYNLYGPTEASIDVTYWHCTRNNIEKYRSVPIGKPIANIKILVLDDQLNLTPIGIAGELCISGIGLARGYINQSTLTNEKFITNPFNQTSNDNRLYKTGDLVRWLPDGNLEFISRIDDQVKIRGHRIELGEIETQLQAHPLIQQAVVLVKTIEKDKQLVAYLVTRTKAVIDSLALREFLSEQLPHYMIPVIFSVIDAIPITASGKIDKNALAHKEITLLNIKKQYVPPSTPEEKILAEIWSIALKQDISTISIHDNFFELGGDSILNIQIVAKARQAGLHLTPQLLLNHPTIHGITSVVHNISPLSTTQEWITGEVFLTPIQHWFFSHITSNYSHFNQALSFQMLGAMQIKHLHTTLKILLQHHDILRARYFQNKKNWQQEQFGLEQIPSCLHFETHSLTKLSQQQQEIMIQQQNTKWQARLNLTNGPLILACHYDLGHNHHRLLLIIHHLLIDGVSWRILVEDLENIYQQLSQGIPEKQLQLPMKTTSYKIWSEKLKIYAQSDILKKEYSYWLLQTQDVIANAAGLDQRIPVDHPKKLQNFNINNAARHFQSIDVALTINETKSLLRDIPAIYKTQINDCLLTALAISFQKSLGVTSLLINLESHGREELFADVDISHTVGWFTGLFPLNLQIKDNTFTDISNSLQSIKEQLQQIPYQGIGYGTLKYLCDDSTIRQTLNTCPRPAILFNYLGRLDTDKKDYFFKPIAEALVASKSPDYVNSHLIEINGFILNNCLRFFWSYSQKFYQNKTVESWANGFINGLKQIVLHYQQKSQENDMAAAGTMPIETVPLSFTADLFFSGKPKYYNYWVAFLLVKYKAELNVDLLKQFANILVKNHEIFRCRFTKIASGNFKSYLIPFENDLIPVQCIDCQNEKFTDFNDFLLKKFNELKLSINITSGPVFIFCIFINCPDKSNHLYLIGTHLLFDFYSMLLILSNIEVLYKQYLQKKPLILPAGYKSASYKQWLMKLQQYAMSKEHLDKSKFWQLIAKKMHPFPVDKNNKNITYGDFTGRVQELIPKNILQPFLKINKKIKNIYNLENIIISSFTLALYIIYNEKDITFYWVDTGRTALKNIDISQTICCSAIKIPFYINIPLAHKELLNKDSLISFLSDVKHQVDHMKENGIDFSILFQNASDLERINLNSLFKNKACLNYFSDLRKDLGKFSSLFQRANEEVGSPFYSAESSGFYLIQFCGLYDEKLMTYTYYSKKNYAESTILRLNHEMRKIMSFIINGVINENW